MQGPLLHQLFHLLVLLALITRPPGRTSGGLVDAQRANLYKRSSPDLQDTGAETHNRQQRAIEGLRALSSEETGDEDKKTRRLSKGKTAGDLLNHVPPSSANNPDPVTGLKVGSSPGTSTGARTETGSETTGNEDDIVHEFDHPDNEAYGDIVWFDGPHREDEGEPEHEHNDDDHQDFEIVRVDHEDHEHYQMVEHHQDGHEDRYDVQMQIVEDEDGENQMVMFQQVEDPDSPQLILMGDDEGTESDTGADQDGQLILQENSHDQSSGTIQHSDTETVTITVQEYCLRLKRECESTCREFRERLEHLSVTCEAGSVAELLFWGKCCQIGQEHRVPTYSTRRQEDPLEQHMRWQQQRHQKQLQFERENGQSD